MLEVTNLRVRTLDQDYLDLWWEIADTSENHLLYSFYIERSESISGPWQKLAGPLKDVWRFRDVNVNLRHNTRKYIYRIRVVEDSSGNEAESEGVWLEAERDLVAKEMVTRMALLFREYVGRKVFLLPVRTFGTRCPDCWDKTRQRRMKDYCLTCFGTSYAGGFFSPMQILMQIDPDPEAPQVGSQGVTQPANTTARALPYPPIKPNDIIIEAENLRWRVMVAGMTRKLRAVVHYDLQLHKVLPGDITYKIPLIGVDLENLEVSPGREFTNPQNIGNLGKHEIGIDNALTAYGFPYTR